MASRPPLAHADATRYLCVGAELDVALSHWIVSEFFTLLNRAVAPSYGFDLVPVIRHALRARRRRAWRDLLLLALVLAELIAFPLPTLLTILILVMLKSSRTFVRWLGLLLGLALGGAGLWAL